MRRKSILYITNNILVHVWVITGNGYNPNWVKTGIYTLLTTLSVEIRTVGSVHGYNFARLKLYTLLAFYFFFGQTLTKFSIRLALDLLVLGCNFVLKNETD